MRLRELIETASVGSFSAGSVATVANPTTAHSKKKTKKQKPSDNALDMKGVSLFGGKLVKR